MTRGEPRDELVNVYDASGAAVGARPRGEAKRSGLAVGAINLLLVDAAGRVLLQRRPADKENGALWDKSVGGHVGAGETFDAAAVREAGEELFDDAGSAAVRLVADLDAVRDPVRSGDLSRAVVFARAAFQSGLRDVRKTPAGDVLNVLYHVAIYLGRTDVPPDGFRRQQSEIDDLRYFEAAEVDALLLAGGLAPNMAFLWLTQGQAALSLARIAP
jgi:ADP-ribose pyrophosphatase YjhB (NUDIX family)